MTAAFVQVAVFVAALGLCVRPLGAYMRRVFEGDIPRWAGPLRWLEAIVYKVSGVDPASETNWRRYAADVLAFSFVGVLAVYAVQRAQGLLPLNPEKLPGVGPDSSFNTAVSFVTNTNWQGYGGETTMSYLTQMAALTVQNFGSAAAGMAVLVALVRGFARQNSQTIGSFWVDATRAVVYVLLPLSLVMALLLVSQGVVQTISPYQDVAMIEPATDAEGQSVAVQRIAVGPAASQVAIKQLGTNGGGFFNANSAHPLENPTPLSNMIEMVAIFLIPASLCYTFGLMVGDRRQGLAILAAMSFLFFAMLAVAMVAERQTPPALAGLGLDGGGGNMEGKEVRFGADTSALFAVITTSASCGAVNSMHDSFTPMGGLVPMWLMQLGEVVFGGVGSGLYGMLAFAIVAVFLAGLMVGRTPEYLGKKIGAFEMKMASLVILIPCGAVLVGTAVAVMAPQGRATVFNPGPHGFSEVLYAFSSAANNNGSAFAGLGANTVFYNAALGLAMLLGRFGVMVPILAIAGSLAARKHVPAGAGTLPTHTPLFVALLVAVVIVVGALSFFPSLALGPIVEQLTMGS